MFAKSNRATVVLFIASVLMLVLAVVLMSQPLSRVAAQQDGDGPKDMRELCVFLAEQDEDFVFNIAWTNGNSNSPIGYASWDFSPEDIFWCGEDFMCFDRPFDDDLGDFCVSYAAIHNFWFPNGAFGD
jgi:hypothetical protein